MNENEMLFEEENEMEEETMKKESKIKTMAGTAVSWVKAHPVKTALGVVATGAAVYFGVQLFKPDNTVGDLKIIDLDEVSSLDDVFSDVVEEAN